MKVDLANQVALVTGAMRGIGQAIADAFAANGARVLYTDLDPDQVRKAADRWPGCAAARMDVTDDAEVQAVVAGLVRDWGRLDILVNNAGINTIENRVPIDQFPRGEWDRIVNVDLTGTYVVSHAAAPFMAQRGYGRIINIASIAGLVPLRMQCAFIAAKAGVVNLTKAMALELGPRGVLVNGIAPGSTLTEGTKRLFYGEGGVWRANVRQMLDHVPLGRPAQPEEIAHAALFLAAPESSYVNGHILVVDGGWTAGYHREF